MTGDAPRELAVWLRLITAPPEPFIPLEWQGRKICAMTEPKGLHYYWKTEYAAELRDELLTTVSGQFAECPVPGAELGFLHLGGAINEHPEDDGAVGNRNARYVPGVNGMWEPNEPRAEAYRQWIRDAWRRQRPFATGRTYINFQTADDSQERVRASYGANYARLADIKRRYDPGDLFRVNRNVVPSKVVPES
ncbi:BBE domain-containing protein [Arthrobacter sp. UYCu712]|uniref:BBE domain-containing protein n=1 Tax=Arthrobacter sp. UYCu712 TaxID=3156340 RepID=UPI003396FCDA